jgi:hypothetical protein
MHGRVDYYALAAGRKVQGIRGPARWSLFRSWGSPILQLPFAPRRYWILFFFFFFFSSSSSGRGHDPGRPLTADGDSPHARAWRLVTVTSWKEDGLCSTTAIY